MDEHARMVLANADWEWPRIQQSGKQGGKYKAITGKLLSCLITESQNLGGTVLDHFWLQVGNCHPQLKANIDKLRRSVPSGQSSAVLFEGVDRTQVHFGPVFEMAAEFFIHLGVAFMNSGGRKSGSGTPTNITAMETDELLRLSQEEGLGQRKQNALKALAFKRDGQSCLLTQQPFNQLPGGDYIDPILAHVIPNSVDDKPDTLKCIAMFAGTAARDLVLQHLNGLGNIMNLESNAHTAYDNLLWGIEAQDDNGRIKYIYRRVPRKPIPGPRLIRLRDGDEIQFGEGLEGEELDGGPLPLLCNLQLAVARVVKMSGAADAIMQLTEDADDSSFPHVYLASNDFCNILDAKLLLHSISV